MARQSEALGGPETTRINERIRANEVRLIGAEGEQLGVVSSDEARTIADDNGLDLVEVAPNAKPPVCRVMDYGKFLYASNKKKQEGKKKQKQICDGVYIYTNNNHPTRLPGVWFSVVCSSGLGSWFVL